MRQSSRLSAGRTPGRSSVKVEVEVEVEIMP
jgi:hypothetical protein